MQKIIIEVSARHCHLSQKDLEKLFGKGYKLNVLNEISQPDQFAAEEEIKIVGRKGEMKLRVVGPVRERTQVELPATDCYRFLGIEPVLRVSGDIKGTPGALLIGPKGRVTIKEGVIVAQRHLHVSEKEAKELGVKNGDIISVKVDGVRALTFDKVIVRSGKGHKKSFQIDTDEGNACGWMPGMTGELVIRN
ncbi:phosphate propanoyltransferase [Candidatus Falkowbacteria bacterium]|nr:phosphate propanoyltransferase [Candidatus Falkowbacteria bacterium]